MQNSIKVLHVMAAWGNGGVESIVANYINEWSKKDIHIEIACYARYESAYDEIIDNHEIPVYVASQIRNNNFMDVIDKIRFLISVVSQKQYDIIHLNSGRGFDLLCLPYIRKYSPPSKIVVHSHATEEEMPHKTLKTLIHYLCKHLYANYYDLGIGCSNEARKWLFRKKDILTDKIMVHYAGIPIQKYLFDQDKRNSIRFTMGIDEDVFVVGHIGRMCYQKNSEFVIELFNEIKKRNVKTKFIYIGDGELRQNIHELIQRYELTNDIVLIQRTTEVVKYLSAMDCFVLPSRFEGLPLVLWEAQANGLNCVVSNTISSDAKISDLIHFLSIDISASIWADMILAKKNDCSERSNYNKRLLHSEIDSNVAASNMIDIYINLLLQ